jgi:hypothetical protein
MTFKEKQAHLAQVCGKGSIILGAIAQDSHHLAFKRLRCNSWHCPYCRRKKAKRFSLATDALFGNQKLRLLTLTVGREENLWTAWRTISKKWNHFRTTLTRQVGRFSFVKVLEPQPGSGFPHLHILVNRFIPQKAIAHAISVSGLGKIFKIQLIQGEGAKHYVKKYLKKDWTHGEALDISVRLGSRRISGSRGFSIRGHSAVSFRIIEIDFKRSTIIRFSKIWGSFLQSQGWVLARALALDDWVHLEAISAITTDSTILDGFSLAQEGLQSLFVDGSGSALV